MFPQTGRVKDHLPARIAESVSEYLFFVSNKKKQIHKQKAKETKEIEKQRKQMKKRRNEMFVNNICGKSTEIRWYRLRNFSVYF